MTQQQSKSEAQRVRGSASTHRQSSPSTKKKTGEQFTSTGAEDEGTGIPGPGEKLDHSGGDGREGEPSVWQGIKSIDW